MEGYPTLKTCGDVRGSLTGRAGEGAQGLEVPPPISIKTKGLLADPTNAKAKPK